LRKRGPRQLSLVFADSPSGGGKDERSDASERRSFLLQKARSKKTSGPSAGDGRMASLKAMWSDLYPPQVSAQLVLEF